MEVEGRMERDRHKDRGKHSKKTWDGDSRKIR